MPRRTISQTASARTSSPRCRSCAGFSSSPAIPRSSTRAKPYTSNRSAASSASATWSRGACARSASGCASPHSSTTSPPAATSGRSATTATRPVYFGLQSETPEAFVAAIEPQLYAAENFHARRKAPDSMDAWDLVMRALSHYWRVTRQDNVVAQALLEKAIKIDPAYGQALGVLATSHSFGAHMGWESMAQAM